MAAWTLGPGARGLFPSWLSEGTCPQDSPRLLTPNVGSLPQSIPHLDPGWVSYRSTQF